jgi:hypothetical protein
LLQPFPFLGRSTDQFIREDTYLYKKKRDDLLSTSQRHRPVGKIESRSCATTEDERREKWTIGEREKENNMTSYE